MEIKYKEIQASLKLPHVVSSSVANIFQPHLKYYSMFTVISLPWFLSQSWTYHWAQVLLLIEVYVRKTKKTTSANCNQLEDTDNNNITCLVGFSWMPQTPKLLYQQNHKICCGLGYEYIRLQVCTGNNRSQLLPGSLKMSLLQFFAFVRKTHSTQQKEMKSLCCYWSSCHCVTDCTLQTTLAFKSYLLLIYIFSVWHDSKCLITCKSLHQGRQNQICCTMSVMTSQAAIHRKGLGVILNWSLQSNADEQEADFMACINKAGCYSFFFNIVKISVGISKVQGLAHNFLFFMVEGLCVRF